MNKNNLFCLRPSVWPTFSWRIFWSFRDQKERTFFTSKWIVFRRQLIFLQNSNVKWTTLCQNKCVLLLVSLWIDRWKEFAFCPKKSSHNLISAFNLEGECLFKNQFPLWWFVKCNLPFEPEMRKRQKAIPFIELSWFNNFVNQQMEMLKEFENLKLRWTCVQGWLLPSIDERGDKCLPNSETIYVQIWKYEFEFLPSTIVTLGKGELNHFTWSNLSLERIRCKKNYFFLWQKVQLPVF